MKKGEKDMDMGRDRLKVPRKRNVPKEPPLGVAKRGNSPEKNEGGGCQGEKEGKMRGAFGEKESL